MTIVMVIDFVLILSLACVHVNVKLGYMFLSVLKLN